MDLWLTWDMVRRRWYVFVVVLLVTVAGSGTVLTPEPVFAAGAKVLIEPVQVEGRNSLASLAPDLVDASTVVAQALAADGYGGRLGVTTEDAFYRVNVQEPGATLQRGGYEIGPVLAVEVRSTDPDVTTRTLDQLLAGIDTQLQLRQRAETLPRWSLVEASVLARDQTPQVLPVGRTRAVVALALLVVLAVLASAAVMDALQSHVPGPAAAPERRPAGPSQAVGSTEPGRRPKRAARRRTGPGVHAR